MKEKKVNKIKGLKIILVIFFLFIVGLGICYYVMEKKFVSETENTDKDIVALDTIQYLAHSSRLFSRLKKDEIVIPQEMEKEMKEVAERVISYSKERGEKSEILNYGDIYAYEVLICDYFNLDKQYFINALEATYDSSKGGYDICGDEEDSESKINRSVDDRICDTAMIVEWLKDIDGIKIEEKIEDIKKYYHAHNQKESEGMVTDLFLSMNCIDKKDCSRVEKFERNLWKQELEGKEEKPTKLADLNDSIELSACLFHWNKRFKTYTQDAYKKFDKKEQFIIGEKDTDMMLYLSAGIQEVNCNLKENKFFAENIERWLTENYKIVKQEYLGKL